MMIKKGFTLSEVMVTLCILGVITAVIAPVVNKSRPDRNKIMLKKAHSDLVQAVSELINDDVNYPASQMGTFNSETVQRGFNYTDRGLNTNIPATDVKFCYLLSQKLNTIGTVDCHSDPNTFNTTDGLRWIVTGDFNFSTTGRFFVIVDVNGDQGPNCGQGGAELCATNYPNKADTFTMKVRYDGKVSMDPAGEAILADPTNNKID